MNKRFLFLSTVLVLLLAACNQPNPTPSTGTLQVNILGLPAGVNASANVTGTDFAQALTATTTLNDRTPGSYTVAASNVSSGTATFAPTVSGSPATVTAGSTATVNVSYAQNLKPGSLTITFTGLPVDTSGSAVVTGPGGNQTVSGLNTVTLNNLVPGQYSISSAPIRVKRTVVDPIFDPTVASANATVTVNPEATTTHAVTYFQRAGTGALWVPTSQGFIKGYANAQLALDGAVDPLGSLTQTGINEQAIFDQAGRLYVSNSTDNAIYSAIGGLPAIQGNKTGLNRPRGMAFDKNGNLWVVNAGIVTGADSQKDDSIVSFSPAQLQAGGNQTPQITLTSTSFFDPIGIAFDASNNLWVSNFGNATILKLSPADLSVTGSVTLAAAITGLNTPTGLAFDSTGNLWVANFFAAKVLKFTPAQLAAGGGLAASVALEGFSKFPSGLVFDNGGNLWVLQQTSLEQINAADLLTPGTRIPTPARTITGFGGISLGLPAFSPTPSNLPIQNK